MLPLVLVSAGEYLRWKRFLETAILIEHTSPKNKVYGIPGIFSIWQFALIHKGKYTYHFNKKKYL